MAHHRLPNYIRTYRRRSGLSQKELSMLLGVASGTKVSRYENFSRMPAVKTIWAFEVVFGQPAQEVFAGHYDQIRFAVQARAKNLLASFPAQPTVAVPPRLARKLDLLRSIVESQKQYRDPT